LALAFRAEVLVDQSNWATAMDAGAQAVSSARTIMDVHRAYAYVLESNAGLQRRDQRNTSWRLRLIQICLFYT